ncbi:unnamed protein product [Rhizophagus irregularis]|nr:unnamed protein product [Rhizophagus irregularis]
MSSQDFDKEQGILSTTATISTQTLFQWLRQPQQFQQSQPQQFQWPQPPQSQWPQQPQQPQQPSMVATTSTISTLMVATP